MSKRRSTTAFRVENDLVLHKLIPHACAYSVACSEGDHVGCEEELEAMALLLMNDLKLPARAPAAPTQLPTASNVTPLARP